MRHKAEIEKRIESKAEYYITKIVKGIAIALIFIVLFLLANYVLMRLWNWLMPDLFGLTTVDYWQALGIFVLAKLIFGFGGGDSGKGKSKSKRKKHFRKDQKCVSWRRDFSEWELYDEFWKEEGETAFKEFVEKRKDEEANSNENE